MNAQAAPTAQPIRRRSVLKKVWVLLVVLLLALGLLVAFAPALASRFGRGVVENTLNQGIAGKYTLDSLNVTWSGPQEVGPLRLADPSGAPVLEANVKVAGSLLGLLTSGLNLGEIETRFTADVKQVPAPSGKGFTTNLEEALRQTGAAGSGAPTPGPHQPGQAPTAQAPLKLPAGLSAKLRLLDSRVTYTGQVSSGAPVKTVGLTAITAVADVAVGKPVSVNATANTLDNERALTLNLTATDISTPDGVLTLEEAAAELDVEGAIPADHLELIAARSGAAPAQASQPDPPARIGAKLRLQNGRLTLADPSRPAFIEFRPPAALLAAGANAPLRVSLRPDVSFILESLDLPVPIGRSSAPDFRRAALTALIRGTRTAGDVAVPGPNGSGDFQPFAVEPFELRLAAKDLAEGIGLLGSLNMTYAGSSAGQVIVDATAAELLDAAGSPRTSGPGRMRAQVVIKNVPTPVLQPFAQGANLDLAELFGPILGADIRMGIVGPMPGSVSLAGQSAATTPTNVAPAKPEGAPSDAPYLAGVIASEKTNAWFDLYLDADRLRSRSEGVKVQTAALGALLRRFLPADAGIAVEGDGIASIIANDFEIPGALNSANGPDLARAKGDVQFIAGDVRLTPKGATAPIGVVSLDTRVTLAPGKNPVLSMRHVVEHMGRRAEAKGSLTINSLYAADTSAPGGVRLTLDKARPEGTITVENLPSSLATLAGEQGARIAKAALGDTAGLVIEAAPDPANAAASFLTLKLTSANADANGRLIFADARVRTDDAGFTLSLARPAEVLNAALNPPGKPAASVAVDGTSPLTLRLSGIDVPLREGSIDPAKLGARLALAGDSLGVTLAAPGRAPERIDLQRLAVDAALDAKGGADATLDIRGGFQGSAFTGAGTIGASNLLGPAGIDIRTIVPRGSITLTDVPSSLVALVSPENAVVAQAALGGTVNARIAALDSGSGLTVALDSPNVALTTKGVIEKDRVTVGPTSISATLTPSAVDAVLAVKAPQLAPRPALADTAKIAAEVSTLTLPITGPTSLGSKPLGVFRVGVRSDSDLLLNNAAVLGTGTPEARPLNVGIRALSAGYTMNDDPSRIGGEASAQVTLFNPAQPQAAVATARFNGGLDLPAQLREAIIEVKDTAALDRWLGTPDLAALALGESVTVTSLGSTMPQVGEGVVLTTDVDAPRLRTRIAAGINSAGVKVQPFDAKWTLDPRLADRYLFTGSDGKPTARLLKPVTLDLSVRALTLGPSGRVLDPTVFRADAAFAAPGFALATPDGVQADLGDLKGFARTTAPSTLAFELGTPGVRLLSNATPGGSGQSVKPLSVKGTVEQLSNAQGVPTPEAALLTANVDGGLPTPLLDALAGQKGALIDLLGARVDTRIATNKLSKTSGSLTADLSADNATANAAGDVRDGVFVATSTVTARMSRITPEASKRFISTVVPLLDKVEKTADDKPAVITATGLTAPLDGDMSKLNADVTFDLGTVQFQSSDFFGRILNATSNRSFGKVGQKIPPFNAKIRQGVVNYERFVVPTGEFELATEGKVDLVKRKMRLTVWVPVLALADEISGALKLGDLPGLRNVSSVPLKISGDLDNPDTDIDWDRLGKDIIRLPGDAADGAGKGVDEILKGVGDLFKKRKK